MIFLDSTLDSAVGRIFVNVFRPSFAECSNKTLLSLKSVLSVGFCVMETHFHDSKTNQEP